LSLIRRCLKSFEPLLLELPIISDFKVFVQPLPIKC
jgi:hypothetical protein